MPLVMLILKIASLLIISLSITYAAKTTGSASVNIQKSTSLSELERGNFVVGDKNNKVGYLILNHDDCDSTKDVFCKTIQQSVKFQLKGVENSSMQIQFKNKVLDTTNKTEEVLTEGKGDIVLDKNGRGNLYFGENLNLTPKQKEAGVLIEVIASY